MRRARRLLLATAVASSLALTVPVGASAQVGETPSIVVENGMTQPVFSFANAIFETHWVETNLDTNGDGRRDRVMFQVARPRETATHGMKVPVVMELSPYRSGTWGAVPYHSDLFPEALPQSFLSHRRDQVKARMETPEGVGLAPAGDEAGGPGPNLPTAWDDYYVPRGYGVVIGQSVGTAQSDGCGTVGDDAETQSAKAIIDWLNGRAVAYDARVGGNPVTADWATGDVGMIGSSYNGTIPNQVATTGVEGLKTIVPVVAISDWYNYYRENGLVVAPGGFQGEDADILGKYISGMARSLGECADYFAWMTEAQDRITGDYNAFWDDRNYLPLARRVKASVFVVDGRNDWNVKPNQWGYWWDELSHFDIPRKIWLHNGGHGTPGNNARYTLDDGTSWTYQQTLNRWFDHELYGVDNGIMDEPRAIVQREPTFGSVNQTFADWPVPGSQSIRVNLTADSAAQPGGLTTEHVAPPQQRSQSFTDNGRFRRPINTFQGRPSLIANPDSADGERLAYVSDVLPADVHLSGTPTVRLRMSVDNASAANLSAYLVDYGPPGSTSATMVTRGWIDVQNRNRRDKTDPIQVGKTYDFRFDLHPDDYVFLAGRRVGLVVISTDYDHTLRPLPGTQLSIEPGFSHITLPLVGGGAAAGF